MPVSRSKRSPSGKSRISIRTASSPVNCTARARTEISIAAPSASESCTSTSSSEINVISVWMSWGERRTGVGNSEPPRSFWSSVSESGSVFRETGVVEEDVASCATTCFDTSSATSSTTSCSTTPSAAPCSGASPPTSCFAASSATTCSAAPCAGWVCASALCSTKILLGTTYNQLRLIFDTLVLRIVLLVLKRSKHIGGVRILLHIVRVCQTRWRCFGNVVHFLHLKLEVRFIPQPSKIPSPHPNPVLPCMRTRRGSKRKSPKSRTAGVRVEVDPLGRHRSLAVIIP